jgi:hypothetical protein
MGKGKRKDKKAAIGRTRKKQKEGQVSSKRYPNMSLCVVLGRSCVMSVKSFARMLAWRRASLTIMYSINRRRFASISSRLIGVLLASTERTVRDLTEKYEHRGG